MQAAVPDSKASLLELALVKPMTSTEGSPQNVHMQPVNVIVQSGNEILHNKMLRSRLNLRSFDDDVRKVHLQRMLSFARPWSIAVVFDK